MSVGMETTGSFVIDNPTYVYGLQRTPNQQRYEEMDAIFESSAFAAQGVMIERNTRVLMLQPVPLQVDTRLTQWQFNSVASGDADTSTKWREVRDPETGLLVIEMPDATADRLFYATSRFNLDYNGCFYLTLYRGEASRDATRSPVDSYTQVILGDGMVGAIRLSFGYAAPPILELCTAVSDSGVPTYVEAARASADISDCSAYLAGLSDGKLRLRVLTLACEGALVVTLGDNDAALVLRMDGVFLPNGPLTVGGKNGVARVAYQPMRFVPLGGAISGIQEHGTPLLNPPRISIDSAQTATALATCEVEIIGGTMSRYALTLDATASVDASGLAASSPVVRSVDLFFPGQTYNSTVVHTRRMNMKRVENESLTFDLGTLSLTQSAEIVCDNHGAQWAGASGYRAGYLEAGINGDNWRRITGWVTSPSQTRNDPTRESRFRLLGKEHWLQRRAVGIIGPLDGYDIYAAIRFLAQLGGVTEYYLQALPYTLPGRGAPSDYYHLPVGTGYSGALFQFDPRTKIWDAMQQLARKVRGYLGFDAFGFLRFYKWSVSNLGGYMQAFEVVPGSYNGELLYNQLKNALNVKVDLSDVRSSVTVGGLDPFTWMPSFAHSQNESVVTDISNPAFLGNEDHEIEISNLLFDADMQNQTLDALAYQSSLPGLDVFLDAYFQHRLFPLNTITVNEGYALGGLYPFYITGMNSSYGVDEQAHFGQSQVAGRWLLNG